MVHWTAEQQSIINKYKSLEDIPLEERKYKCTNNGCKVIIKNSFLENSDTCPICHTNTHLEQMCPLDSISSCAHTTAKGVETCPICGNTLCPDCGNHEVVILSRITGYYSPASTGAWNSAKVQELSDRRRYNDL